MEFIVIQGYIGNDASVKEHNGVKFTHLSVAVTNKFKDAGGVTVEKTQWYSVFKRPTKQDEYLKKGVAVFVQGDLTQAIKSYQGKDYIACAINNARVTFSLGNRKEETAAAPENTNANNVPVDPLGETDKINENSNNNTIPPNTHFDGIAPDDDLPF